MARHHKKTRKHSRRRRSMRGGFWSIDPRNWGKPAEVATAGVTGTVTKTAEAVAPLVPSAPAQAAAVGAPAGSADILGPTASTATALGGRRKRTRKHRKSHRKH